MQELSEYNESSENLQLGFAYRIGTAPIMGMNVLVSLASQFSNVPISLETEIGIATMDVEQLSKLETYMDTAKEIKEIYKGSSEIVRPTVRILYGKYLEDVYVAHYHLA